MQLIAKMYKYIMDCCLCVIPKLNCNRNYKIHKFLIKIKVHNNLNRTKKYNMI